MQLELFYTCVQCGETVSPANVVEWTVFCGQNDEKTYQFCSESCRSHFAINQMRRFEGSLPEVTQQENQDEKPHRLSFLRPYRIRRWCDNA